MKKLATLLVATMLLTSILVACGATPEPEVVKETVVVMEKETVVVTEKEQVEVTKVVKEEVEKVVTATPEPEEPPPPPPSGTIVVWGWEAALNDTLEAGGVLDDSGQPILMWRSSS